MILILQVRNQCTERSGDLLSVTYLIKNRAQTHIQSKTKINVLNYYSVLFRNALRNIKHYIYTYTHSLKQKSVSLTTIL